MWINYSYYLYFTEKKIVQGLEKLTNVFRVIFPSLDHWNSDPTPEMVLLAIMLYFFASSLQEVSLGVYDHSAGGQRIISHPWVYSNFTHTGALKIWCASLRTHQ